MGECLTRDVELITRREISYLQATVYYFVIIIMYYFVILFVYHINTRALYCQEKSTLLKNENKRIGNLRKKIVECVGALKMNTCVESRQTQTMGLISIYKILKY